MSVMTTLRAPAIFAIGTAMQPIGPAPVMRTSSPTRSNAKAVWTAFPSGSEQERTSIGIFGSHRQRFVFGTGTSSKLSPGARSRFTSAGIVLLTASKLVEGRASAILFPSALAFGGIISDGARMAETLERAAAAKPSTPRSVFIFRFGSTIVLWSLALGIIFSGYEIAFFALIGTLGMLSLWEFYGMLDHKGLPNFKITAMICGAVMLCGSFYYFSRMGPGHSYDFEVAVLLFFLLTVFTRQMFDRL